MTVPRSNASHDQNHVPTLMGVSTTDGTTPVPVEVDPTTGQLQVSSTGGGGSSGTQYTDGDATITHPIGTIPVFNKAGTITAVSDTNPLPTSATVSTTGLATSTKQDTGNTSLASIDSKITAVNTGAVVVASGSVTANAGTNLNTSALALDATLTGGTQQTKLTDGTNTANVLKSDGTAAGQNAAITAGTGYSTSTVTLNSGTPATSWYDMLNYAAVSVEILTNTTPATLTFQTSGDASQTNITNAVMQPTSSLTSGVTSSTTSATQTFYGSRQGRYFRVNSNNGAGTTTLVLTFFTVAAPMMTAGGIVSQSGTWTVGSNSATGSAVPANGFYVGGTDGTNLTAFQVRTPADGQNGINGTLIVDSKTSTFNGTQWDRARAANNATGTTGTGVPASGVMGFDGTNYQRLKTDTTGVASINTAQINGVATTTGNGVSGTGVQRVTLASDSTGQVALAAGSAIAGKVGIDQTTPGTTNAVVNTPVTSGGLSIITGSVGATATVIKASAGQLYGYHFLNTTAAVAYVQIFNVAAASVTLGVTSPTISIGIPASGGVTVNWDKGVAFGTAMSYACTTTRAGASGATCDVNFFYA